MSGTPSFESMTAQQQGTLFWAGAAALILVKLALVSDLSVQIACFPYDNLLCGSHLLPMATLLVQPVLAGTFSVRYPKGAV